jgi:hypothetical protein
MVSRKLAKIMGIFVKIGHTTAQIVTYWPERIRPAFPTLWSGHDFGHKFFSVIL